MTLTILSYLFGCISQCPVFFTNKYAVSGQNQINKERYQSILIFKEDFSMKEKYIKPDVELEEYKTLDVITTSGGDTEETDPWGAQPTPFG